MPWRGAARKLDNRRTVAFSDQAGLRGSDDCFRLRDIPGIGVDKVGDAADAAADPRFLRLENGSPACAPASTPR
jgi:hypothetical protein